MHQPVRPRLLSFHIDSRLPKLRSFQMPTFIKQIEEAFEEYPEENITTFACHLSRAIDPPGDIETPINADVFARVLPDVVAVRGGVL